MTERWLRAVRGSLEGKVFRLGPRTILGRSGTAQVQIIEREVSRQHAVILIQDDGQAVLVDLSSTNGTRVGDRLVTRVTLRGDDQVGIGQSAFIYGEGLPSGDADDDESKELRVLSGAALDSTAITNNADFSPAGETAQDVATLTVGDLNDCGDRLHRFALGSGWTFCPACGGRLT